MTAADEPYGPLQREATVAAAVVRDAGREAQRILQEALASGGIATEQKTSVSDVVTAADLAAEALIVERLAEAFPDDAIVGEEGTERAGTSGRTWVIDPVDGTWNFVSGLTWWCSAVALTDADDVLLGAVHHPHDDVTWVGGPSTPPTRNGVALKALADRALADSCLSTYLHPPHYGTEVGAAFTRMVQGAATVRMLGSGTLDQLAVAEGRMHVLAQHSVPAWDWLPGTAILRGVGGLARHVEAGGVTWSVAGTPTAVDQVCARLGDPGSPSPTR